MNRMERDEIRNLPDKYRPLGAWGYFGLTILFNIPVIGFIFLIVFSLSSANINRRSFARSYFCGLIIVLIIGIVVGILFKAQLLTLYEQLKAMLTEMMQGKA